jgi:tetratricopeptide (TPR) repeat protein
MRRILLSCLALVVAGAALMPADAQMMPGSMGGGGMGGGGMGGRPSRQSTDPAGDSDSLPAKVEKPDASAKKAFDAGLKSLRKAKEYEEAAATAPNPDKKARALEKLGDAYGKALDQFTEVLRNKGDMYDAWNNVGYVHLRLGAYAESVDDYNHALTLKPDLLDAIEHRGEAYLGIDRLDDAKSAYMDLFSHARPLADQLMLAMQQWLTDHRANANGMRVADVDAFDKWLQERDGIAKQTASLPH